jgi:hypothetical protein
MSTRPLGVQRLLYLLFLSGVFLTLPSHAGAHCLWTMPAARDQRDGYKPPPRDPGFVLPCGVARAASQPTTTLPTGAMQLVKWTETVYHPGCFLIEFAKSDTDPFSQLMVYKHPNTTTTPMPYETMVTLPDQACVGCILRVRQVMLGSNTEACPPANMQDLDTNLYYSCANITLEKRSAGGSDAAAPGDAGSGGGTGGSGAPNPAGNGGGGCAVGGARPAGSLFLLAALALVIRRRRRS